VPPQAEICGSIRGWVWFMVFNATVNNISALAWL